MPAVASLVIQTQLFLVQQASSLCDCWSLVSEKAVVEVSDWAFAVTHLLFS